MKKGYILIIILAGLLLQSCGIYRYTYIQPDRSKLTLQTYSLQKVDINNSEVLLLDRSVLSNSVSQVMNIVLKNNGYTVATNGSTPDMLIQVSIFVEDNDVINNKQNLSIFINFSNTNSAIANFMISSRNKDILLDKQMLVNELNNVVLQIKSL